MPVNGLLDEKITVLDLKSQNNEDAIKQLGQKLINHKYIKKAYIDNVITREKTFPTGLVISSGGVAIPHAAPTDNIMKNGIAAARLMEPVHFYCMEDPEKEIPVNIVFLLALSSSSTHLAILKKLFSLLQDNSQVNALQTSSDKTEFLQILSSSLK